MGDTQSQSTSAKPANREEWLGMPGHVYCITLRGTSNRYLGVTYRPVQVRWDEHVDQAGYTWRAKNIHFYKALRKYGVLNFDWEWLGTFETVSEALDFEVRCIALGLTHYNCTKGGEGVGGRKHTEETKHKISQSKRGCVGAMLGKKHSPETRARISATKKGRGMPLAAVEAARKACRGKPLSEEHKRKVAEASAGRKHTAESKQRIREANTGRKYSAQSREKMRRAAINRCCKKKLFEAMGTCPGVRLDG